MTVRRGERARRAYVNARLFDPAQKLDCAGGTIIADGRLIAVGREVTAATAGAGTEVIDCRGRLLVPGLVDRVMNRAYRAVRDSRAARGPSH